MSFLDERRASIADAWDLTDAVVLIHAGASVPIAGTDEFYEFRAHPEYRYLADNNLPNHVLAYTPSEGWIEFVPVLSQEQSVWFGGAQAPGRSLAELDAWVGDRTVHRLGCGSAESDPLRAVVTAARRLKDGEELVRIRKACLATGAGYEAARAALRPGATERQVQIELESDFRRAGGSGRAFDTIVAGGPNSAVLHFAPTDRVMNDGELVLIDSGAAYGGYCSDVTRTYPVNGTFTAQQRAIYDIVLEAQVNAIGRCRAGAEYKDVHLAAAVDLARGLADFGLLRGKAEDLVDRNAHALFFPHGLGHLLGLSVHDVGGYLEGRKPSPQFGLANLRTDLPLAPGIVVTIEPGLYFIPVLLNEPSRREEFADAVDWERVDAMLDFGGIRIEDDVLVTDGEPEVLTSAIPK